LTVCGQKGATENAGMENAEQIAEVEHAKVKNAGVGSRGGICRSRLAV